jgi:protein-S-isoprenylcysteine O-methyltransferase Ste14
MSGEQARSGTAGVIAPPPLIGLATLVIGVAADWLWPLGILHAALNWPARIVLGAVLLIPGWLLVFVGERSFKRVGTNVPPWRPALALATDGAYRYLRNPMYVGAIMMLLGIAAALASDWIAILIIPTALTLHFGVVLREERYLEAKFGDDYRAYKARVPRYGRPR